MAENVSQLQQQPVEPPQLPQQAEPQPPRQQLPQSAVQPHKQPQLPVVPPDELSQKPAVPPDEQPQLPVVPPDEQSQKPVVQPDEQPQLPAVQLDEQSQKPAVQPDELDEQSQKPEVQPDEQPQLPVVPPHEQSPQPAVQLQEQPQKQKQGIPEHLLYKKKLNEYAQKSALPVPVYHTVDEGLRHAPRFRSSVLVGTEVYASPNEFPQRKAAEQDAARHALETITTKMLNDGFAFIQQDTLFCKSMLNEFANKMGLKLPIYNTKQPEGLQVFIASLDFDSATYTGEAGRSKREAEKLAARVALLSILVNPSSRDNMLEVIKSKERLFSAAYKVSSAHCAAMIGPVIGNSRNDSRASEKIEKDLEHARPASFMPATAVPEASFGQLSTQPSANQPHHEFVGLKSEEISGAVALPVTSLPASQSQPSPITLLSSKRKSKGRKRVNKRKRSETQSPVSAPPASQVTPCTIAE